MKTAVVKRTLAAVCALFAALCVWHSSGAQGTARARSQDIAGAHSSADDKKAQAEELFDQYCARCHGRDGRGATQLGEMLDAPDFTDKDWWKGGVSDERMRAAIAEGKGEMPAFGRRLSRPEVASLIAYVRAFAPDGGRKR
jgi:mono/diheme cytochrome c family protein